jgi:hypothetical protein
MLGPVTSFDTTCPSCGRKNDGHMQSGGKPVPPEEGDLSICFGCGGLGVYVTSAEGVMSVRLPNEEEAVEYAADKNVQRALAMRERVLRGDG